MAIFIGVFLFIAAGQIFFWVFANSVFPIVVGMPFSMFVVTALVIAEFVALVALYFFDRKRL